MSATLTELTAAGVCNHSEVTRVEVTSSGARSTLSALAEPAPSNRKVRTVGRLGNMVTP